MVNISIAANEILESVLSWGQCFPHLFLFQLVSLLIFYLTIYVWIYHSSKHFLTHRTLIICCCLFMDFNTSVIAVLSFITQNFQWLTACLIDCQFYWTDGMVMGRHSSSLFYINKRQKMRANFRFFIVNWLVTVSLCHHFVVSHCFIYFTVMKLSFIAS